MLSKLNISYYYSLLFFFADKKEWLDHLSVKHEKRRKKKVLLSFNTNHIHLTNENISYKVLNKLF